MKKLLFLLPMVVPFAGMAKYNCTIKYTSCNEQAIRNIQDPGGQNKVCKRSCTPTPASNCAPDSCTPQGNQCTNWSTILNNCKTKPAAEVLGCIVKAVQDVPQTATW